MAYSPLVNSSSVRSTTVSLIAVRADVGEGRRDLAQVVTRTEVDVDRMVAGVAVELDRDVRAVVRSRSDSATPLIPEPFELVERT